MVERLVEFLSQFIQLFVFVRVVDCYEQAVLLRLGKFKRVLQPGPHFVVPFAVDSVLKANVVIDTLELPPQAFATRDGVDCVATAIVSYRIRDIAKFLLEVENAESVLADATRGPIRQVLCSKTWNELQTSGSTLDDEIWKAARRKAFQWGIELTSVSLSDLVRAQAFRVLLGGNLMQQAEKYTTTT
jgi:regulator of protease activity HflC (stomatin/prohibitin superfamily)